MTIYRLVFDAKALREFRSLDASIQNQLRKKLRERLSNPRVEADRLSKIPDGYKIKLRKSGFRLIYQVRDVEVVVMVVAIGKRDSTKWDVYDEAVWRLDPK